MATLLKDAQGDEQKRRDVAEETAKEEVAAMITADLTPNSEGTRPLSINELVRLKEPKTQSFPFSTKEMDQPAVRYGGEALLLHCCAAALNFVGMKWRIRN